MQFSHISVMLDEVLLCLDVKCDGVYIDGTAGGGGHSQEIAQKLTTGKLVAIDQDPDALAILRHRLACYDNAVVVESNFVRMDEVARDLGISQVQGVLLDLGVSSHQLDTPERGFSYHHDAPLDMRMSKSGVSAYDVVNEFSYADMARIIRLYGEDKNARRIASAIVSERDIAPIHTTGALAEIIKNAVPAYVRREHSHPARKTFQAIRIFVNSELEVLEKALDAAFSVLAPGGRLVVITFHSLEDRIVKRKMAELCKVCTCPPDFPICVCGRVAQARLLHKGAIEPTSEEIAANKRSRSAKLRACVKL